MTVPGSDRPDHTRAMPAHPTPAHPTPAHPTPAHSATVGSPGHGSSGAHARWLGPQRPIVGRELTGPLTEGRPPRRSSRYLLALPAVLLTAVLLIPMGVTVGIAFGDGSAAENFGTVLAGEGARALLNSILWLGLALVVSGAGLVIAYLTRRRNPAGRAKLLLYVLVAPFGMAALTAGVAFRMLFDPSPERGVVTAALAWVGDSPLWLGPGWIWWVLFSAFLWLWLGFAVSLFRAGIDTLPRDLLRTALIEQPAFLRRARELVLPMLRPIVAIVLVTTVVAAIRLFDLVLITAPRSVQDDVDVLGVFWWRLRASGDAGGAAAAAVVLFVIVAAFGLWGMRGLRRRWAMPAERTPVEPPRPDTGRAAHLLGWPLRIGIGIVWVFPIWVLVATAAHDPVTAGTYGWLSLHGLDFGSFVAVLDSDLIAALIRTALIAGLATAVVLVAAVPAAYLLTWGGLARWFTSGVLMLFVVLAVAPVQMYAGSLADLIQRLGLSGTPSVLILVHGAAGLPFAVLLLRAAFVSAPPAVAAEIALGQPHPHTGFGKLDGQPRAALVAVSVLEFVQVWNDFIIGFLINGPGASPFTLVLWGEARQIATASGSVAASAVLASLVPVVVLLKTWPTVVRGLTGGALR